MPLHLETCGRVAPTKLSALMLENGRRNRLGWIATGIPAPKRAELLGMRRIILLPNTRI
jgi:hypothetical protein